MSAKQRYEVRVSDLHVLIVNDGEHFYAQGVEVDYAAGGDSLEDVQSRFQHGLRATINANIERFGDVSRLLKPTPGEIIEQLEEPQAFEFSMTCTADLEEFPGFPYNRIAFQRLQARD